MTRDRTKPHPSFPPAFALYVGEARVTVSSELPEVCRGLWAVWRSAVEPVVATRQEHHLQVRAAGDQAMVYLDGAHVATAPRRDALPVTERVLYASLPEWFAHDRVVLHGAFLAGRRAGLLLIGQSGAGKSSLAWSGVQRGYQYGGDEVCFSDGEGVWGVPRAVMFDPTLVGNDLPDIAASADRDRYRFANWHGRVCFLPICQPPAVQVLREPLPLGAVKIVLVEHGTGPRFERASSLQVLAALMREGRGDTSLLVPSLQPDHCYSLRWERLDWAWQHLGELLGGPLEEASSDLGRGPAPRRTAC